MGNQQGQNLDFDQVSITTNKQVYFVGEIVKGNIYLNLTKDGFPASAVLLKFIGKEQCRWTEEHVKENNQEKNENQIELAIQNFHGKFIVFSHQVVIQTFNFDSQMQAQYTFPFEFQLPINIPGSFFEEKQSLYSAKIAYKVKVEIESNNKTFKNLKTKQLITVREPINQIEHYQMKEMEQKVKTCCCEDKGIKCVCERDSYLQGDTACLQVDIDNSKCLLDISRIEASLKQYLTLKDNSGRQKVFINLITSSSAPGVQKGATVEKQQMKLLLKNSQIKQEIQPSSNGQLVNSSYRLEAKAILAQFFIWSSDPCADIPLQIVAKNNFRKENTLLQPRNWNPQIFKKTIVQFSESTRFTQNQSSQNNNVNLHQPGTSNQFQQMNYFMN